jgi:hypothetical protein
MKFGVREICDVVLKAKTAQKIGNKTFFANEPVIYFDTLKTSSMEGGATTVYAQGGRGNTRLVAWEGERTVTFTMEDALISPEGFMILSGAGLIDASAATPVYQHITETIDASDLRVSITEDGLNITLGEVPYLPTNRGDNFAYVMLMKNGEIISEPYIPVHGEVEGKTILVAPHDNYHTLKDGEGSHTYTINDPIVSGTFDAVLVDYYTARTADAQQIEITADKFGGNYYLEASTLFRDQNGVDMPAEFIIPNCKIQSNFTFTMASSGDPSTFTFTMDAFPDYTRFDHSKKVLAAIQIIKTDEGSEAHRDSTWAF